MDKLVKGVDKNTGEYVYGYLIKTDKTYIATEDNINRMILSITGHANLTLVEVIPETVGWNTGKKDKTGKYIYTNDIVKVREDEYMYRCFYETTCWYGFVLEDLGVEESSGLNEYEEEELEIVGTCHHNPEYFVGLNDWLYGCEEEEEVC